MNDDVLIAVDPHKASNTAAVLDPVTKTLIETARFAHTEHGYAQLVAFAGRREQRRWAVEGCHGPGRSLTQRLVADGELVLDVPAKLAARVRAISSLAITSIVADRLCGSIPITTALSRPPAHRCHGLLQRGGHRYFERRQTPLDPLRAHCGARSAQAM